MHTYKLSACCLMLAITSIMGGCARKTTSYTEIRLGGSTAQPVAETKPVTVEPASVATNSSTKSTADIQKKYAVYLKTTPEKITNIKLYRFIDEWLNTPYLWGGNDKNGIDCSALMLRLYKDVYNIEVPRTSADQFFADKIDRFGSRTHLSEGDLIFFKTIKGRPITHVGFYLGNRMFINSSSSKGVSFGDLDDPYWKVKYVGAGRIKI